MRIFSRNFHKPWPRNPWPIAAPSAPADSEAGQQHAPAEPGEWSDAQATAGSAKRREEVTIGAAAIGAGATSQ